MESNGNKKPVKLDARVKQVGGTLIIREAKVDDSGKYLCMVNNSVGGESVETVLTVTGKHVQLFIYRCPNKLCINLLHISLCEIFIRMSIQYKFLVLAYDIYLTVHDSNRQAKKDVQNLILTD